MAADLHVHTICSDSTLAPRDVIELCVANDIGTVAITDHDTVAGLAAAEDAGRELGVRVVRGVELTVYEGPKEVHIVGLFIDPENAALGEVIQLARDERTVRVHKMVALLQKLDIRITVADVLEVANGGAPGRPHVAQALVKCGQVASIADAFKYYIGDDGPAHVPKHQLQPAEAADAIHAAGGAAIVGHPGAGLSDKQVRLMIDGGMDGIEVYHPLHSESASEHYLAMAHELGLLVSGGSDCHGAVREGTYIGAIRLADEHVEQIRSRADEIRSRHNG